MACKWYEAYLGICCCVSCPNGADYCLHEDNWEMCEHFEREEIKPTPYILVPVKNGSVVTDSRGNPRIFTTASMAFSVLKEGEYDYLQIYTRNDGMKGEEAGE